MNLGPKTKNKDALEDLLADSDDEEINNVEDSLEFQPPPISSHEAATGFEANFTETIILEDNSNNNQV